MLPSGIIAVTGIGASTLAARAMRLRTPGGAELLILPPPPAPTTERLGHDARDPRHSNFGY
eukprot:scaffold11312_cov69-Phaeocystis_antarctica.AAC.7